MISIVSGKVEMEDLNTKSIIVGLDNNPKATIFNNYKTEEKVGVSTFWTYVIAT